jgi:RNA polymerase sigma-70 factor (ECF subfamily)
VKVHREFRAMYEREFPAVFRAVRLFCGDAVVAEDATQEAFARALARWKRIGSRPWAAGWVTTTALNVARRSLRRRPTPTVPPEVSPDPDRDEELDLIDAIRRLPSRQQEAVALHYLLDLPIADAAAAMGCDPGTVKTHLARARTTLAGALRDGDDESSDPRSRDRA